MKILLTGFTTRMAGSERIRYDYVTSVSVLKDALTRAGHQVEQRTVRVGESLKGYDAALVGLCPPNSLTARFIFGSFWTLNAMNRRVALYADDWSIINVQNAIRTMLKVYPDRLFRLENRVDRDVAQEARYLPIWQGILQNLAGECSWPILLPLFSWGKPEVLLDGVLKTRGLVYDPTAYHLENYTERASEPRERRWVLATLQDHSSWVDKQRFTWPVLTMGNRRRGEPFQPEAKIFELYTRSWGVLSPLYPKNGSGWWRHRYLMAAQAGAVLYADPKDARHIPCRHYQVSRAHLEAAADDELAAIAAGQREFLLQSAWRRDQVIEALDTYVRELNQ